MANRMGKSGNSDILFSSPPKSLRMVTAAMKLKDAWMLPERKVMANLDSVLKSRDITLLTKVCIVKSMVFPLVMYGCECWIIKKAEHCRTDAFKLVLEKTLQSPVDCKEIKRVRPKGNQSWPFTGRIDTKAEAPILWSPDMKSRLIGRDPDVGKNWRQKKKRVAEDEIVSITDSIDKNLSKLWETQGSLACHSPRVTKSQTQLSGWTTTC